MPIRHIVQQGEHGSAIANQYGFLKLSTVWEDDINNNLRQKRQTADILLPGDEILIPDKVVKSVAASTGKCHRYVTPVDKIRVRLRVRNLAGKPIARHECKLTIEGRSAASSTDGDGIIDGAAPRDVTTAQLKIDGKDFAVAVGRLDPIRENSGWQARLINLGYLEKPNASILGLAQIPVRELQAAIEEFQCDHGIALSGTMDNATIQSLRDVHGC